MSAPRNEAAQELPMSTRPILARLLAAALLAGPAGFAVQAAEPAAPPPAQAGPSASADERITANVKAALRADPDLSAVPIDVSTRAGVVVLQGTVPNLDSARQAIRLVASVPGVRDVRNELTVAG
jgi:hyperosmotically inducible protein